MSNSFHDCVKVSHVLVQLPFETRPEHSRVPFARREFFRWLAEHAWAPPSSISVSAGLLACRPRVLAVSEVAEDVGRSAETADRSQLDQGLDRLPARRREMVESHPDPLGRFA